MVEADTLKALGAGAALGGLACFLLVKSRNAGTMLDVRSTTASGSVVYESARAVVSAHFPTLCGLDKVSLVGRC
jgi:hypothetical protein